jgi:hypothetical protein
VTDLERLLIMIVNDFTTYVETGDVAASSRAYTIVLSQQFQARINAAGVLDPNDEERHAIIERALLH